MTNAVLVTRGRQGGTVRTPLRLANISTDLTMQMSQGQTKRAIIYRPIRLQERFLIFSALWPASERQRHDRELERIVDHWAWTLNGGASTPMRLIYRPDFGRISTKQGGGRTYRGYIQAFTKAYAWNDVLWTREFAMRILTQDESPIGARLGQGRLQPYIPHRGDVSEWGPAWYRRRELALLSADVLYGSGGDRPGTSSGGSGGRAGLRGSQR